MTVLSHYYSGLSVIFYDKERAARLKNISALRREVKSPTGSVCIWFCRWEEIGVVEGGWVSGGRGSRVTMATPP